VTHRGVQEDTCAALQSQYDAMVADFDACRRYVGITRAAVTIHSCRRPLFTVTRSRHSVVICTRHSHCWLTAPWLLFGRARENELLRDEYRAMQRNISSATDEKQSLRSQSSVLEVCLSPSQLFLG
jgi:hypothetical protein